MGKDSCLPKSGSGKLSTWNLLLLHLFTSILFLPNPILLIWNFYLNCKDWIISGLNIGCPNLGAGPTPPNDIGPSQIAAVRCCSDDVCITPESCSETTFDQAKAICATNGKRLCTVTELAENKCCGTGCGFDRLLTWYSGSTGMYERLTCSLLLSHEYVYFVYSKRYFFLHHQHQDQHQESSI